MIHTLFVVISLSFSVLSVTICNTCKHFIPDSIYPTIGRCQLFHTGKNFEIASVARMRPSMCNSTKWESWML